MAVLYETPHRPWTQGATTPGPCLEDKYEVIKEIGDGSFGSVSLARVRTAGAAVARRGTMVAVKTMKKTFDNFHSCLELREVIFLRTLPGHYHLVPALDLFLDPMSKKLHIAMEYMDGNLYQLMKARDHKYLDSSSVKSILYQIISGLEHIHAHHFFHRDIKPENILVSTSAPQDTASSFKRYSALVTPPSTPPVYTVKIADFGLARETQSKVPYTTYVSTRWYRAPEVLLRAGEYSAPVDIWAVGAMAVEVATLKPLFPGSNEVDQVWRICEIMGSPGNWFNKHGNRVGGGEWKDGIKLASKLGFSFPKMAPHSLDTILRQPTWPASLSHFVTWCLMWDPKSRPTASQALAHEYLRDAVDPLRPKSSRILSRKQSAHESIREHSEQSISTKTSNWFRRSLIQREISAPAITQQVPVAPAVQRAPSVQRTPSVQRAPSVTPSHSTPLESNGLKPRANANKRATWAHGPPNAAPIPLLPSIRPVSPLYNAVAAQATIQRTVEPKKPSSQLPVASRTADPKPELQKSSSGTSGLLSPPSSQKESFFSHLRKRARRFSGRYQTPISPNDDIESNAGSTQWNSRQSPMLNSLPQIPKDVGTDFSDLDKALQSVRTSIDSPHNSTIKVVSHPSAYGGNSMLKRHHSSGSREPSQHGLRQRAAGRQQSQSNLQYETPDEEDELLDEALNVARNAAQKLHVPLNWQPSQQWRSPSPMDPALAPDMAVQPQQQPMPPQQFHSTYLTPAPSANRSSVLHGHTDYMFHTKPLDILKPRHTQEPVPPKWPTPPYDESDWGSAVQASLFSSQPVYR